MCIRDRGENGRDDTLAEGVVERVVDRGRGNAKASCGVAVDGHIGGEALILLVARNVLDLRQLLQAIDELGHPGVELVGVGVFEHELVLRAADGVVDGQILHRLHVEDVYKRQVLTHRSFSVSGLCQNCGATSITT